MPTICHNLGRPGEWLASLDLKDPFVLRTHKTVFLEIHSLRPRGDSLSVPGPPLRLSTLPRIFTKVLAPAGAAIRLMGVRIHPYLDDILI